MRNPFAHLLFLVVPFLLGELGREIASAASPRTTASASPSPRAATEVCTAAPAPKSVPAPFASPRTNSTQPATPTARRPLPAHLFM